MNNEEIRERIQKYKAQLQEKTHSSFELDQEGVILREKIRTLQQACSHCEGHKFQLYNGHCIYCGKIVNGKKVSDNDSN